MATFGVAVLLPLPALFIARKRGLKSLTPAVLLFSFLFPLYAIYVGNGRLLTSGDNLGTRALPSRILTRFTLDLTGAPYIEGPALPYAVRRVGQRLLNIYPPGTAFLALPHAALALVGSSGNVSRALVARWDKHSSAIITIAAVGFFFAAVWSFGIRVALGSTLVFALATPLPSTPSQSLWILTGEVFFVSLAVYLLLGRRCRPTMAGFAAGMAFASRPTALVIILVLFILVRSTDRKLAARYGTAAAIAVTAAAVFQLTLFGNVLGAYASGQSALMSPGRLGEGLLGVFLSPSRGLLWFFPYLLLVPFAGPTLRREQDTALWKLWWASLAIVTAFVILVASHSEWWGGWSLGPRLMTECAPFLALLTAPLWSTRGWVRRCLMITVVFSAATQLLLAYNPAASDWNRRVHRFMPSRSLVGLAESQLLAAWIPGWLDHRFGLTGPRTLDVPDAPELTGSIDSPVVRARVGDDLWIEGWARIPGEDLAVFFLIDGRVTRPVTLRRVPRPDVQAAVPVLGDCSSAGFEALVRLGADQMGTHDLGVILRARDGRARLLALRRFESTR